MLNLPLDVLTPAVESVGLVSAVRLSLTCRQLLDLQPNVIGKVCKRLCSRQITPPVRTRSGRMIPANDHMKFCSVKMEMALGSTWLQTFVEEIDCLFMSTGAIVASSHSFAHFPKLAQVSLPKDGWGSPCEKRGTFARTRQNLLGEPRLVNIWYSDVRFHPPRFMWCMSPCNMIQKCAGKNVYRRGVYVTDKVVYQTERNFKRNFRDAFIEEWNKTEEQKVLRVRRKVWAWTFENVKGDGLADMLV